MKRRISGCLVGRMFWKIHSSAFEKSPQSQERSSRSRSYIWAFVGTESIESILYFLSSFERSRCFWPVIMCCHSGMESEINSCPLERELLLRLFLFYTVNTWNTWADLSGRTQTRCWTHESDVTVYETHLCGFKCVIHQHVVMFLSFL